MLSASSFEDHFDCPSVFSLVFPFCDTARLSSSPLQSQSRRPLRVCCLNRNGRKVFVSRVVRTAMPRNLCCAEIFIHVFLPLLFFCPSLISSLVDQCDLQSPFSTRAVESDSTEISCVVFCIRQTVRFEPPNPWNGCSRILFSFKNRISSRQVEDEWLVKKQTWLLFRVPRLNSIGQVQIRFIDG